MNTERYNSNSSTTVFGPICQRRQKKQRRNRQKHLVTELLYEYSQNSTLHGLRYFVKKGHHLAEKIFWVFTVILSIALCSYYIKELILKWKSCAVIVTFNGRLSSVETVQFPSVTICPEMKVNPQAYDYMGKKQMFMNVSLQNGEEFDKFSHIVSMCDIISEDFKQTPYTNSSIVKHIIEAAPSLHDIFFSCKWHGSNKSASGLISDVITEDGLCFTVNSMDLNYTFKDSVQSNYPFKEATEQQLICSHERDYNSDDKFYSKRVLGSDPDLSIVLINDPNKGDKNCNEVYSGYKIYLHSPKDFPQTSSFYYAVLPNQVASLAMSVEKTFTASYLKKYDTKIRQCYYALERPLHYFKIYTAANCRAECLSNYTLNMCNCVGFFMPHGNNTDICNPGSLESSDCMRRAKEAMMVAESGSDHMMHEMNCNCLPSCNTVQYGAEILKTDFRAQKMLKKQQQNSLTSYSRINLFYMKSQFVTLQRRELFGVTDLLADIGGLLGLFLGFSFLSLIEIFYYFTVRVGFILRRDLVEERRKSIY